MFRKGIVNVISLQNQHSHSQCQLDLFRTSISLFFPCSICQKKKKKRLLFPGVILFSTLTPLANMVKHMVPLKIFSTKQCAIKPEE